MNSTKVEEALAVATEFRSVLRYAIDIMPQPVDPLTTEDIFCNVLQRITASVHGAFEAALLLCSKGWGLEANALLRQMLEAEINARVVKRVPSALYLYISMIECKDSPDVTELPLPMRILGLPASDDKIARIHKGKRKGELRKWKELTMPERIRLSGLKEDIWFAQYGRLCEGLHVSAISLRRHVKRMPGSEIEPMYIWFGPNWQAAFNAVGIACALLLAHIGTISSTFNLNLIREIGELGKRLEKLRDLLYESRS